MQRKKNPGPIRRNAAVSLQEWKCFANRSMKNYLIRLHALNDIPKWRFKPNFVISSQKKNNLTSGKFFDARALALFAVWKVSIKNFWWRNSSSVTMHFCLHVLTLLKSGKVILHLFFNSCQCYKTQMLARLPINCCKLHYYNSIY
jgi:hypothetical protein